MSITLTVNGEMARRLRPFEDQLERILEMGLHTWCAQDEEGYAGVIDVLNKLASLPTPEEVLALKATPRLQERIEELLEKNRESGFSQEEKREWEQYMFLEHLVRMAKISAVRKQKERNGT